MSHKSPVSIRHFTAHSLQWPGAFALPREVTALGVKRYGFHGLSYEYIASVLPSYVGPSSDGRVVMAHLGGGASMCALRGRRSVASLKLWEVVTWLHLSPLLHGI